MKKSILIGLPILLIIFGFSKDLKGCIYYQPSVTNGTLTSWNDNNGSFTVYPNCPKCGTQYSSGLTGGEGLTAGKKEIYGSCIKKECKPKGEISYSYKCIISWPSPKCD